MCGQVEKFSYISYCRNHRYSTSSEPQTVIIFTRSPHPEGVFQAYSYSLRSLRFWVQDRYHLGSPRLPRSRDILNSMRTLDTAHVFLDGLTIVLDSLRNVLNTSTFSSKTFSREKKAAGVGVIDVAEGGKLLVGLEVTLKAVGAVGHWIGLDSSLLLWVVAMFGLAALVLDFMTKALGGNVMAFILIKSNGWI